MQLHKVQKSVLALIIANIIWGAASPIFKWSLTNIEPFTLAFLRFFLAAYLLLPFVYKRLAIAKTHIPILIAGSFVGVTINISFFFIGLKYSSSVNAPIISSSGPILLVIASILFLKEKPKRKVIYGMLISLVGVIIVIIRPLFESGLHLSFFGNLLFVVATIGGVIHTIFLKKLVKYYDPMLLTFWTFLIGSVSFLPFMLYEISLKGFLTNLSYPGITGILFGVLLSSAVAYYLTCYAMRYLDASEIGIFTNMDPIVAIIIAVPLLGEKITAGFITGTILVFLGLFLAEGKFHYQTLRKLSQGLKSLV